MCVRDAYTKYFVATPCDCVYCVCLSVYLTPLVPIHSNFLSNIIVFKRILFEVLKDFKSGTVLLSLNMSSSDDQAANKKQKLILLINILQ